MQSVNHIADKAELRRFGIVVGLIIAILFGLALPYLLNLGYVMWPWIVGAALLIPGVLFPKVLAPIYKAWMLLGVLLNKIVSPVVLGILFFGVFLPYGLVMRLMGKDPLHLKLEPNAETYRVISSPISDSERPF